MRERNMIKWDDIYKMTVAMVPLYVPLVLGYCSVKYWHMFTKDQGDSINTFSCYFIIPFLLFEFLTNLNPLQLDFLFIAADIISKLIILIALTVWANYTTSGNYEWSITSFSLSTLNNTLFVAGVPFIRAMYGELGNDLALQSCAFQSIFSVMLLLFMLEIRRTRSDTNLNCNGEVVEKDLEGNDESVIHDHKLPLWRLTKIVGRRLAKTPNFYACTLGLVWTYMAFRWDIKMPSILEESILVLSRAGSCTAMFCIGLFMGLQEKIISCGVKLTVYGMLLRFIVGPGTIAISCFIVGLRGNMFRIAVIQAALPQSITAFTFAKEFDLHANVLSTAVIFGTLASLPVLIGYYAILQLF